MRKLIGILLLMVTFCQSSHLCAVQTYEDYHFEYDLENSEIKEFTHHFDLSEKEMRANTYFIKREISGSSNIQILKEEFEKTYYHIKVRVFRNKQEQTGGNLKLTLIKDDYFEKIPQYDKPDKHNIYINFATDRPLSLELNCNHPGAHTVIFQIISEENQELIWENTFINGALIFLPANLIEKHKIYLLKVYISNPAGKFSSPQIIRFKPSAYIKKLLPEIL